MKVLFAPDTGRWLGAQAVGHDGVDKRIDVLATALKAGMTVHDLAKLELAYQEFKAEKSIAALKKLTAPQASARRDGQVMSISASGIVALLFGLGLLRGTKPFELFMTSVSLAVAAVPEGLPAAVTVALALGVFWPSNLSIWRRRSPGELRNYMSIKATAKTTRFRTGSRRSGRFGKMSPQQM